MQRRGTDYRIRRPDIRTGGQQVAHSGEITGRRSTVERWKHGESVDGRPGRATLALRCHASTLVRFKISVNEPAALIATAAPGKHEVVRAQGANHVIDSRGTDLAPGYSARPARHL